MLFQYLDISYAVCYVLSDYVNTCLIRNEEEELIDWLDRILRCIVNISDI